MASPRRRSQRRSCLKMWMRSTTLKWSCDVGRSCGSGVSTGYRRRYCGAVGAGGGGVGGLPLPFFLFLSLQGLCLERGDGCCSEDAITSWARPLPPPVPFWVCPGWGTRTAWRWGQLWLCGEAPGCSDAEHSVLQPKSRLLCRRLDELLMGTWHSRGGGLAAAGGPQSRPGSYRVAQHRSCS